MPRKMPAQKRGESRQDYGTPPELKAALERRFGPLAFDLAATAENTLVPGAYFDEWRNSLVQDWARIGGTLFLNPPFAQIMPWAKKCRAEAEQGARILMLVPAAVGSVWFATHVHRHALVLALVGRITFVGETQPYPKDCMIAAYGWGVGFDCWRWDS